MSQSNQKSAPRELAAARQRVDAWRAAQGGVRRHIPEEIWSSAVHLTGQYSLTKVSTALGLPYESLRKRVGRSPSSAVRGAGCKAAIVARSNRVVKPNKQRFVELPTPPLESSVASIELRSPTGATLFVRTAPTHVAQVAAELWRNIS